MINLRSNKDINRISNVMSKNSSHRDQAIRKSKLLLDSTNLYMTDENIPKKTIKTKNNLINNRLLFKPSKKISSRTGFMSNDRYYPPFYMELIIPKPYDESVLNEYYTIYIDRDENKNYESFEEHFRQINIAKQPKIARHIKYVNRPRFISRHRPSHRPRHRHRHRPRSRPRYNNYYNTIRYEHDYPYYYGQYLYYPFNYYFNLYDNNLPFDLNYAMIPLEIKDDSSKDGLSKDGLSKGELSKDDLSKDGSSKDELSKDGLSKDDLSKDGSSKDELSKDGLSKDGSSKDGSSKDGSSKGDLSKDGLSKGGLSKGGLSKGDLSKDGLSKGGLSKGDLSKGDLSKGGLSKGKTSKVKELFIPEGYKLVKVKIVDKAKKINLDDSKYLLFFIILFLFYFIVVKGD
jgi:pentapeptide MXKDX repeat protein